MVPVADRLAEGYVDAEIETSVGNGRLLAYMAEHGEVTGTRYNDSRVTLSCRLPRHFAHGLGGDDTTVTLRDSLHGKLLTPQLTRTGDGRVA